MNSKLEGLTVLRKERINRTTWYYCKCRNAECNNETKIKSSARHEGYCKSCGNANKRIKPYEALYNVFKRQAKRDVTLSYSEFVDICEQRECHYCGGPTIRSEHNKQHGTSAMIDRKDNNVGYTVSNSVSCCWNCNDLKSDRFTYEQFVKLSKFIKNEL